MASGWWDNSGAISGCVAAYQPIGAASLAASYVNLQNPGVYDCAPGTAPTFATATGWTFTGTQWLTVTGLSAAAKPVTIIARATFDSIADYRTIVGASGNGGAHFYLSKDTSKIDFTKGAVAAIGSSTGTYSLSTEYVVAITYGSAGAFAFYRNGSSDGVGTVNQTFTATTVNIGAFSSGALYRMSGKIAALAIYHAGLTAGQIATLSASMAALPIVPRGLPIIAHYHHAVFGGG